MKRIGVMAVLGLSAFGAGAQQAEWDYSLRGADQPSTANRPWDQGAGISYQSVNGTSTAQVNAVLKAGYTWRQALRARPGERPETGGSIQWSISPGIYLHKNSSATKPQDDHGLSLGFGAHYIPGGSAAGAVISYDFAASLSFGQTRKAGTAAAQNAYFDVDSDRQQVSASMYLQPGRGAFDPSKRSVYFFTLGGKLYSDHTSGAQNNVVNGRVSGVSVSGQASWAPLGLNPAANVIGSFGFAPVFTFNAQKQHDTSASGGRIKGDRSLYAVTASFPFTNNSSDSKSPVPSIDFQRSVGADLLQGRDDRGETRIMFSLKF